MAIGDNRTAARFPRRRDLPFIVSARVAILRRAQQFFIRADVRLFVTSSATGSCVRCAASDAHPIVFSDNGIHTPDYPNSSDGLGKFQPIPRRGEQSVATASPSTVRHLVQACVCRMKGGWWSSIDPRRQEECSPFRAQGFDENPSLWNSRFSFSSRAASTAAHGASFCETAPRGQ